MYFRESRELFADFMYKKGIEEKRIVKTKEIKLDNSLKCLICDKLVINPSYCNKCKHLFCERCSVDINRTCTICPSENLTIKIPQAYNIMMSKYTIYCKNRKSGCSLILFYENLLEHEENCHHERLLCIFPDCFERIKRKNYPFHIKNCKYRIIKCKYCSKDFIYDEYNDHAVNCEERLVSCYGCNKQILNKFLAEHVEFCDKIKLICERCKKSFLKSEIASHTELICVTGLILDYKKHYEMKVKAINEEFFKIQNLIKEKEKYFEMNCNKCKRFACEVALKKCQLCKLKLCTYCAKSSYRSCNNCHNLFCESCFNFSMKNKICFSCNESFLGNPDSSENVKKTDYLLKMNSVEEEK
jgi:hypothetical protein